MKRLVVALAMMAMLTVGATTEISCNIPDLFVLFPANVVTVEYVNDADADVAVWLYTDDEDDEDADDLVEDGEEWESLVPVGEAVSFNIDCDDVGSMVVGEAQLLVLGNIGPSTWTDDLHIGEEYECGDVVTFTFYNSPTLTELHAEVSVSY